MSIFINIKNWLYLLLLLLTLPVFSQIDNSAANKMRTLYMYNFTKYIEWPPQDKLTQFKIGIYAPTEDDVYENFIKLAGEKKALKLPINVAVIKDLSKIKDLQILFVACSENNLKPYLLKEIRNKINGQKTLLVTDGCEGVKSMINFIVVDNKLKFEINKLFLEREGFTIKDDLLCLGIMVDDKTEEKTNNQLGALPTIIFSEEERKQAEKDWEELFLQVKDELNKEKEIVAKQKQDINTKEEELKIQKDELEVLNSQITLKEKKLSDQISMLKVQEKEIRDKQNKIEVQNQTLSDQLSQMQMQKLIIYLVAFILILVGFGIILIYRNNSKLEAKNKAIEQQKKQIEIKNKDIETAYYEIEEKNSEIMASIRYAQRIQESILPPQKLVHRYFNNSFILYKPKDIVAGDFYWMECLSDNTILFASCDCTGHGVPGAFVSIVGHNGLNRCVNEFKLTEPAKILDKLSELVEEAFSKTESEIKDGMDIALCSLNISTGKLQYAGANNPLWIIKKGNPENQLTEIVANKQPIGKYAVRLPYTNHSISLQRGDSIYIFTDGYADQFGGPRGKKFKYSQFSNLLLSIQSKPMAEQKEIINNSLETWKGELEQVDDICVIGVSYS